MKWKKRIKAARARGSFTDEDSDDANSWLTCAVGELDADLLIGKDDNLKILGLDFANHVDGDRFDEAEADRKEIKRLVKALKSAKSGVYEDKEEEWEPL